MNILPILIAYLYGSIPFSYILPRVWKGIDVTRVGSRNVGASNAALATNSFAMFFVCFLLDATKGFLPALLWGPVAGALGVVGHIFSIFMILFKFRLRRVVVGLGMSATIGYLIVVAPLTIPIALASFVLFYLLVSPIDPALWYKYEEGNIATVFAVGFSALIYVTFFHPDSHTTLGMLILVSSVFVAYARRIRQQLIDFWNFEKAEHLFR